MALIARTDRLSDDQLSTIFQSEVMSTETPAAQQAFHTGLLHAKREAMRSAERLIGWGRPLLVGIIAVSFLHLWDTIAAIRPAFVGELRLPAWLYHATAAALTLAIDAAALFCLGASATAALVGASRRHSPSLWFFLVTTFLLNAAFLIRYAPAFPSELRATLLPGLEIAFALLIPAMIPVGLFAIESSTTRLRAARLKLLVETTVLDELVRTGPAAAEAQPTGAAPTPAPQPASQERHATPLPEPAERRDAGEGSGIAAPHTAQAASLPPYSCPNCGTPLASISAYGAAKRWNRCAACKPG